MTSIEKALYALKIADEFCGKHTAEDCPDYIAVPIKDAIKALEAEKPAEDAKECAKKYIKENVRESGEYNYFITKDPDGEDLEQLLNEFAESYHVKNCAECKKIEPRKYYPLGQEPIDDVQNP